MMSVMETLLTRVREPLIKAEHIHVCGLHSGRQEQRTFLARELLAKDQPQIKDSLHRPRPPIVVTRWVLFITGLLWIQHSTRRCVHLPTASKS
jgi:hypothetical protein